ncbi:MerR family transcriptional regulator [Segnochrobactraceae bacterium EtOH-i3]
MAEQFFTVTQLAQSLGITARTVRFYDDKGLVTPSRAGTTRVYTQRDRARLILILRGKRLGFTLREIKEYLDLYELDRTQKEQLKMLLKGVRKRIDRLEEQSIALKQTLEELRAIEGQATSALTELDASDAGGERQAG